MSANKVNVLHDGYSYMEDGEDGTEPCFRANCSCVLVTGEANVIIDTMTPWDGDLLIKSLRTISLDPGDIDYVVSTHGHSDHVGNNHLFLKAKHIVGYSISFTDKYYAHPFNHGQSHAFVMFFYVHE